MKNYIWKPKLLPHPCLCGCGEITKKGNNFICGHNNVHIISIPMSPPQLCECGCGEMTKEGRKYIYGHWSKSTFGKDHPNFIDGKKRKLKNWRLKVLTRDKYVCQKCKKTKRVFRLDAHHIKSKKKFPELMFDEDNGETLCHGCHMSVENSGEQHPMFGTKRIFSKKHKMNLSKSMIGNKNSCKN